MSCGELNTRTHLTHGFERSFKLVIPCNASDSTRIVVLIHCYGCDASFMVNKMLNLLHDVVLVAPEGIGRSFNGITCCGKALAQNIDDVGFVSSIVSQVKTELSNDAQVSVVGFSNGAYLTSLIASSEENQWVSSMILVSGFVPMVIPSRPLPVLILHGTFDEHLPWQGCCASHICCCNIPSENNHCDSVVDLFSRWNTVNGCQSVIEIANQREMDVAQIVEVPAEGACYRGATCATNLYLFEGGHTFDPSSMMRDFIFSEMIHESAHPSKENISPPNERVTPFKEDVTSTGYYTYVPLVLLAMVLVYRLTKISFWLNYRRLAGDEIA